MEIGGDGQQWFVVIWLHWEEIIEERGYWVLDMSCLLYMLELLVIVF